MDTKKEGDLLVSEGGEVGRSCIWENELEECYIQNSNNSTYFLNLFFIMGQKGFFDSIVNRISIAHLTAEKLKEIYVVCPHSEDQTAIVQHIKTETVRINAKTKKNHRTPERVSHRPDLRDGHRQDQGNRGGYFMTSESNSQIIINQSSRDR